MEGSSVLGSEGGMVDSMRLKGSGFSTEGRGFLVWVFWREAVGF